MKLKLRYCEKTIKFKIQIFVAFSKNQNYNLEWKSTLCQCKYFQLQNCGHTIKSSRKIEISKGQQNGFCFDVLLTSVMLWHYSGFSQTNCCYGFTKMLMEKVTWFGLGYPFIHYRTLLVRFTDRLLLWLKVRQSWDLFF